MSAVRFVRIRGKIVPIMQKAGEAIKGAGRAIKREAGYVKKGATHEGGAGGVVAAEVGFWGAILTGSIGGAIGSKMAAKDRSKLIRGMKTDKDRVDAKKATSSVMKNVTVVSTQKDADKAFKTDAERKYFGQMAVKGTKDNAFAMRYKNKDYVFTTAKVSRTVLGHELGHIKDYRTNGTPGALSRVFGSLTGATLSRERRAWEYSPFKKKQREDMKQGALGTYEKRTRGVQAGVGVAGAGVWMLLRKMGRM